MHQVDVSHISHFGLGRTRHKQASEKRTRYLVETTQQRSLLACTSQVARGSGQVVTLSWRLEFGSSNARAALKLAIMSHG